MNWPSGVLPPPPMVSVLSEFGPNTAQVATGSPSSGVWPTANRAFFIPITLPYSLTLTKFWALNGASAANNVDIGVYTADGTLILSTGSQTRTGTSTLQAYDVTDTSIGPGLFYIAMVLNNTTGAFFKLGGGTAPFESGVFIMDTAFPLPATATFASHIGVSAYMPIFGFSVAPTV